MSAAPIADVEVIAFEAAASPDDCDGAADTVVIRLTDEQGRIGVGEADAPAEVVRAFVDIAELHVWSRGLRGLVPHAATTSRSPPATQFRGAKGSLLLAAAQLDPGEK